MPRGMTVLELVVVIMIIGIIAALAIPNLAISLERSRIKEAEFNLMAVYNAEKRFYLYNGSETYYYAAGTNALREINANLSLNLEAKYFQYAITNDGAGGFIARATRLDGMCKNEQMTVTADNSNITKGCTGKW